MRRGEIYWCDLEPRRGREQGLVRPVLVISVDAYNASQSPLVGVVPLTRSASKNPLHVTLQPSETGLPDTSTALIDHARFIDRSRLQMPEPAGKVNTAAQTRVDRNLARLLGLSATVAY